MCWHLLMIATYTQRQTIHSSAECKVCRSRTSYSTELVSAGGRARQSDFDWFCCSAFLANLALLSACGHRLPGSVCPPTKQRSCSNPQFTLESGLNLHYGTQVLSRRPLEIIEPKMPGPVPDLAWEDFEVNATSLFPKTQILLV